MILNKKCGLDRQFVYTFVFLYLYLWLCICICAMECFKVVSWSAGGSTVMSDSHSQRWALYSLKHSHRWALPCYSNTLTLLSSAFHYLQNPGIFKNILSFSQMGRFILGNPLSGETGNFKKKYSWPPNPFISNLVTDDRLQSLASIHLLWALPPWQVNTCVSNSSNGWH